MGLVLDHVVSSKEQFFSHVVSSSTVPIYRKMNGNEEKRRRHEEGREGKPKHRSLTITIIFTITIIMIKGRIKSH